MWYGVKLLRTQSPRSQLRRTFRQIGYFRQFLRSRTQKLQWKKMYTLFCVAEYELQSIQHDIVATVKIYLHSRNTAAALHGALTWTLTWLHLTCLIGHFDPDSDDAMLLVQITLEKAEAKRAFRCVPQCRVIRPSLQPFLLWRVSCWTPAQQ